MVVVCMVVLVLAMVGAGKNIYGGVMLQWKSF